MPITDFIDHPGRPGAFGAIMDEYARAADDFCRVVEFVDEATFEAERPSDDPGTKSPRTICEHVCRAARGYANAIDRARTGTDHGKVVLPPGAIGGAADVRGLLADGLRWTERVLDGLYEMPESEWSQIKFEVSWGPTYDPEMILEHAIVHLLRHRRQLERW